MHQTLIGETATNVDRFMHSALFAVVVPRVDDLTNVVPNRGGLRHVL
jgi:hypothetical protein